LQYQAVSSYSQDPWASLQAFDPSASSSAVTIPFDAFLRASLGSSPNIGVRAYDGRWTSDSDISIWFYIYHVGAPALNILKGADDLQVKDEPTTFEISITDDDSPTVAILYTTGSYIPHAAYEVLLEGVHPNPSIIVTSPLAPSDSDDEIRLSLSISDGQNWTSALTTFEVRSIVATPISPNTYIGTVPTS
jgi:hypothetical protein